MMKNERIITHFQSYTTAEDCVKDLTPYFAGRISIVSPMERKDPDKIAADAMSSEESKADGGTLVERVVEVGGTAVGTLSYLIPGASSLLTGGPVAGAAIGAAVGGYLTGTMYDDLKNSPDIARQEEYLLIVQTHGEKEADKVLETVQRHGGTVSDRQEFGKPSVNIPAALDATSVEGARNTMPDTFTATAHPNADTYANAYTNQNDSDMLLADFTNNSDTVTAGVPHLEVPGEVVPDRYPQRDGQAVRRVPRKDGYELDPIPPTYSNNHWVDPNIGYGNVDNADPAAGTALIEDR